MSKVMNDAERNHGVTCWFLIYAPIDARQGLPLRIKKNVESSVSASAKVSRAI